ncbi:MAG: acireductone synthase [Candidatus Eremiobacteraeota bacterium]|nr:acireductone synthase [Candidatus Eremiobacteraeota bacterium]
MRRRAKAVLSDIEGTTGSIAFVHDVLFPYADARLDGFVQSNATDKEVAAALRAAAQEAGIDAADRDAVTKQLHEWIAADAKVTPLKTIQGLIWAHGYAARELKGHVYPDAAELLRRWHDAGVLLYIYSSGSVAAQKLIFGHSIEGDLTPLLSGYFDTTTGPKRDARSYATIARIAGVAPAEMLFLSDSEAELDAARATGMQTIQLARTSDGTQRSDRHDVAASFLDIELTRG